MDRKNTAFRGCCYLHPNELAVVNQGSWPYGPKKKYNRLCDKRCSISKLQGMKSRILFTTIQEHLLDISYSPDDAIEIYSAFAI